MPPLSPEQVQPDSLLGLSDVLPLENETENGNDDEVGNRKEGEDGLITTSFSSSHQFQPKKLVIDGYDDSVVQEAIEMLKQSNDDSVAVEAAIRMLEETKEEAPTQEQPATFENKVAEKKEQETNGAESQEAESLVVPILASEQPQTEEATPEKDKAITSLMDLGLEEEEDEQEEEGDANNQEMGPLIDKSSSSQSEQEPPAKAEPEGRTSRINFYSSVEIKPSMARCEYTEKEIFETWYSKNELQRIQQDNLEAIKRLQTRWGTTVRLPISKTNEDSSCDDTIDDYCLRGLEDKTGEGFEYALTNRRNAVGVVLNCQGNRIGLERDSHLIARLYEKAAANSREMALQRGMTDAEVAAQEGDDSRNDSFVFEPEEQILGWFSYLPCYIF